MKAIAPGDQESSKWLYKVFKGQSYKVIDLYIICEGFISCVHTKSEVSISYD